MAESMIEKLPWIVRLLEQIIAGGKLRFDAGVGNWRAVNWYGCCWEYGEDRYRVLPLWAWELVDAEESGKTIQYRNHDDPKDGPWRDRDTSQIGIGYFDAIQRNWRIKPDPEPVRTPLTAEQMRDLVGKIADDGNIRALVVSHSLDDNTLFFIGCSWNADELMNHWNIDGKPAYNETTSDNRASGENENERSEKSGDHRCFG